MGRLLFIGPPGSGKTVAAQNLKTYRHFNHPTRPSQVLRIPNDNVIVELHMEDQFIRLFGASPIKLGFEVRRFRPSWGRPRSESPT